MFRDVLGFVPFEFIDNFCAVFLDLFNDRHMYPFIIELDSAEIYLFISYRRFTFILIDC